MATLVLEDAIDKPRERGIDLPYEDGEPLESDWHVAAMHVLIDILRYHYRGQTDIYVAGNIFVYFAEDQVKTRDFRGPDFFVVKGAQGNHTRQSWMVWKENGLTPDYVIELASETTKLFDRTKKKTVYEQDLKTPEYVIFDPDTEGLSGWRLDEHGHYQSLSTDHRGWLWSEQLNLWLGAADDTLPNGVPIRVPRFFDAQGHCLLTKAEAEAAHAQAETERADTEAAHAQAATERADTEAAHAKAEAARADAAEAEIAHLKAELAKKT